MATKDRLIGALDDPKSFLAQERVDASIIWLNNGFLEYKIPKPLKNGGKKSKCWKSAWRLLLNSLFPIIIGRVIFLSISTMSV